MKIHNVRKTMVWVLVMFLLLIFSAKTGQTGNANKDADKMTSGRIEKQKSTDNSKIQAASTPVSSKIYVENPVKGTGQAAIFGEATATSAIGYNIVNYGGYFRAAGVEGRGIYGEASNTGDFQNYGGYFLAAGVDGTGVYGEASHFGGFFMAKRATNGIGVYASATGTNGSGVIGEGIGDNGRGVVGAGRQWDFYALNGSSQYGPFTGGHEVRLSEDFPVNPTPGMIVSVTGQAKVRKDKDGTISLSSTLPTVMISSVPQDRTVFGVFVSESSLPKDHWYKAREGERFGTVNALGEGRVWVTNQVGEIQSGDYITASAIPGYGERQNDDLLHSYTLGKAIETIDWDQVTETVQHDGKNYKRYLVAVVYTSG
jgi:hypothetical protein